MLCPRIKLLRFLSASFFFVSLGLTPYLVLAAKVVTETVGQAGQHVITSREVQISSVIEQVLSAKTGTNGAAILEVRPGQNEFRGAATAVLLEVVVALEAENFNVAVISPEELAGSVAKVERMMAGRSYWADLEVSEAELKRFLVRKLSAKSFLRFKTGSMSGIITDQEAQSYYDKNRVKFGSTSFLEMKDRIKDLLAQQQLEDRLRAWFEVIKRKYKVRSYIPE